MLLVNTHQLKELNKEYSGFGEQKETEYLRNLYLSFAVFGVSTTNHTPICRLREEWRPCMSTNEIPWKKKTERRDYVVYRVDLSTTQADKCAEILLQTCKRNLSFQGNELRWGESFVHEKVSLYDISCFTLTGKNMRSIYRQHQGLFVMQIMLQIKLFNYM